jgi:hypothetical protein
MNKRSGGSLPTRWGLDSHPLLVARRQGNYSSQRLQQKRKLLILGTTTTESYGLHKIESQRRRGSYVHGVDDIDEELRTLQAYLIHFTSQYIHYITLLRFMTTSCMRAGALSLVV